jgi:hypothetical protein
MTQLELMILKMPVQGLFNTSKILIKKQNLQQLIMSHWQYLNRPTKIKITGHFSGWGLTGKETIYLTGRITNLSSVILYRFRIS